MEISLGRVEPMNAPQVACLRFDKALDFVASNSVNLNRSEARALEKTRSRNPNGGKNRPQPAAQLKPKTERNRYRHLKYDGAANFGDSEKLADEVQDELLCWKMLQH